jgi:hypothetical protein
MSARDLDDYRRLHERALSDLDARLTDMETFSRENRDALVTLARSTDVLGRRFEYLVTDITSRWGQIDHTLADLSDSASVSEDPAATSGAINQLAEAQAEDLERILEVIEETGVRQAASDETSTRTLEDIHAKLSDLGQRVDEMAAKQQAAQQQAAEHQAAEYQAAQSEIVQLVAAHQEAAERFADTEVVERLDNLIDVVSGLTAQRSNTTEVADALVERLDNLTELVNGVRRRIALRGRPEKPTVQQETIDAIAEAVADRLKLAEVSDDVATFPRRRRPSRA